jgi:hypothetical protein
MRLRPFGTGLRPLGERGGTALVHVGTLIRRLWQSGFVVIVAVRS